MSQGVWHVVQENPRHSCHRYAGLRRDPSPQRLAQQGAKLMQGDFNDASSLDAAVAGMDAVFLNVSFNPFDGDAELSHAKNVIAAARTAAVPATFYSSVAMTGKHRSFPGWGPDHPQYRYWMNKHEIETMVREAGFTYWTIIRPAFFLQNFQQPKVNFMFPELETEHVLKVAYKSTTKLALVDGSDVGLVVARGLSDPAGYTQNHFDLAVAELVRLKLAKVLAQVKKTPVKLRHFSDEELESLSQNPVVQAQLWVTEVGYKVDIEAAKENFPLTGVLDYFAKEAQ
ncbi:NAD dependent epimerase/dehydratase [Xylariomycetidae sp. FL0641]|nr:NAD dependent epimerase/dehydratase [Xylariomycetidae sp. FL0641]